MSISFSNRMNTKNLLIGLVLIILVLIFVGGSYYLLNGKNNSNQEIQRTNDQQLEAKQESNEQNQGSGINFLCNQEPCCNDYQDEQACFLNYLKNCEYLKMEIKSILDSSKNLFSKLSVEIAGKTENSKCKINVKMIDYPLNNSFNNKEMVCLVNIKNDPKEMQKQLSTFSECSGELFEIMKAMQST